MSEDHRYNGWTNYETWAVALWIDNEEGSYRYWRERAREILEEAPEASQVIDGIWTVEQAARFNLADALKDEVEEASPLADAASLYSDLLGGALSEVNWNEIAGNWIEEAQEAAQSEEASR